MQTRGAPTGAAWWRLSVAAIVMAFALFGAQALTASAAAAATVTAVSPITGPTAGGTPITITGTGFTGTTPATGVTVGGVPAASVVVVSDISITAVTPGHASGIVDVIVDNGNGASAVNAGDKFTYTAPTPTVTGLTPATGSIGGGTLVQINGTGFLDLAATGGVKFDTTVVTYTVVSDTQIQSLSPAHAAGVIDVTVTASGGTSTVSSASKFTYTTPQPVVTSLAPSGGPIAGGTAVTINGSGFTGATQVTFGGLPLAVPAIHTDTAITVTSPAAAAGTVDVSVTTPVGTSANTAADNFTYGAVPVVTAVAPTTGGIAGGMLVTVTGTGLMGTTSVSIGGIDVVPANVTDTSLT
ncbi:MAG: IPT/TIG domain-containing protein, partial [Tepidiformaceae bacterium]